MRALTLLLLVLLFSPPLRAAEPSALCPARYASLRAPAPARSGLALVEDAFRRVEALRGIPHVKVRNLGFADGFPVPEIRVNGAPDAPKVFLSAGVHGDEGDAVLTALSYLEWAAKDAAPDQRPNLVVVPMVNPGGLRTNERINLRGEDVNRSFKDEHWSESSRLLRDGPATETYDVAIDLHGAVHKQQFFLISSHEDDAFVRGVLSGVPPELLLPSTEGTYPGWAPAFHNPRAYQMHFPGAATSFNVGTLKDYFAARGTPRSFTLEYPGAIDFGLEQDWNFRILDRIVAATWAAKKEAR